MAKIHPTAIVADSVQLADSVEVGPYCILDGNVRIGENTRLISHVIVSGNTTVGDNNLIYPFACLGTSSQDLKHRGMTDGKLTIGNNNTIREHATMHLGGTEVNGRETVVGDGGLFMVNTHVAHDCRVGNGVIMSNNATLAGHVCVEDNAIIGGLGAVHQFCRIGKFSMVGGCSGVTKDVIPYALFMGAYGTGGLRGLNLIGLKRKGFDKETISAMMKAYKDLFDSAGSFTFSDRVEQVAATYGTYGAVMDIINFIKDDSSRSIEMPIAEGGN